MIADTLITVCVSSSHEFWTQKYIIMKIVSKLLQETFQKSWKMYIILRIWIIFSCILGPPEAVNHKNPACSFPWALPNDQKSRSKLKVTWMSFTSDVIFSLTRDGIPVAARKHSPDSTCFFSTSLPQSESRTRQFSTTNSTTVSAPLELIYHQFPFHHAKLFLEAEIGPIPASTTFHYSQELNTWWPPLSSQLPYQVKASFLFPGRTFFYFFTAKCLRAVPAQSPLS